MLDITDLPKSSWQPQKYFYKWDNQKCFTNMLYVAGFYMEQEGQTQKSIEVT